MLKLKNVWRSYQIADFIQIALCNISIAFRKNEFVAILGPSGSGKTTMLNIIGGLDKYEAGDLEIDGISTENFEDHDWDTYRNNRIGFVFQSYNLIPHQTILANVELALTISGISAAQRRSKAKKSLTQVGLGDHFNKKPNQLSGGQMQRVAIARALINDPEILLADEPTGALDSNTSTQVMNLLQKIAKNRLVIMVTHDNELAEAYANRIVTIKDGSIISDTRPLRLYEGKNRQTSRKTKKSNMSFMTAILLSFSNLMTKKKRTIITSLAGSIGIIGVATIIALASGINAYIRQLEEGALSLYPLIIQSTSFDFDSFFEEDSEVEDEDADEDENPGLVQENRILGTMLGLRRDNDLVSLKNYLEDNRQILDPLVNTIHYMYDITPQIFLADITDGPQQVNPYPFFALFDVGENITGFNDELDMNVFHEMPNNIEMFEADYDIVAGQWPTRYNEAIIVLSYDGRLSDAELFAMGLREPPSLEDMMEEDGINYENNELELFSYDTLMAVEFSVVNAHAMYHYDDTFNIWVTQTDDDYAMESLIEEGIPLRIVGIAKPGSTEMAMTLSSGINYTSALIDHLITDATNSEIVREQIANPEVNVFTGRTFAEDAYDNTAVFDFSRLVSTDDEVIDDAFTVDMPDFEFDISNIEIDQNAFNLDLSDLNLEGLSQEAMPPLDLGDIAVQLGVSADALAWIMGNIAQQFFWEAIQTGITDPDDLTLALTAYMGRPEVQENINLQLGTIIDSSDLQGQINALLQTYVQLIVQASMEQMMGMLETEIQTQIQHLMESMTTTMAEELELQVQGVMDQVGEQFQGLDPDILADAFQIEMDEDELFSLMTAIMNPAEDTYEQNLNHLGFANLTVPFQISIYPQDFESKQELTNILDSYNDRMEANGQPERVVHYLDLVGDTMSGLTDAVNMISYALITFVAISLIVSSIMIGVITYISVLERKKEIGILRAIGASKKNIRRVFNAETLIIGFISGVFGVVITLGITTIANIIVEAQFGIEGITHLPTSAMVMLIGVSMLLTFLAGMFPSSAAARKDPIEALRSD